MASRYPQVDLSGVRRVSIEERGGTVSVNDLVTPYDPGDEVDALFRVVPDVFAGGDLKRAVAAVVEASKAGKSVLLMYGAHFIKCGLARLLIDLMERRVVTAVATNGAGAIHDFELASWGVTSEDVAAHLADGTFGMCGETADALNGAAVTGRDEGLGLGESVGRALVEAHAPHIDASVLGRAAELGVPATVHVAMGTDIVHEHASADGAAIGETSLTDFRILASVVGGLDDGVILNVGSAVILPEVFLKALAVGRNLGTVEGSFTAVGMDMNEPYRATLNVLRRPTAQRGMGIAIRGRHELLFPLFWAGVRRGLA